MFPNSTSPTSDPCMVEKLPASGTPPQTTSISGRFYSIVLKGCKLVAQGIKLLAKIIFGIIALPFIIAFGVAALIGGAVKSVCISAKNKKQPAIPDKTREVKKKEHEVKFEAMKAVITAQSFIKEFDELKNTRDPKDPEIVLIEKFLTFFKNAQDENHYPQYNSEFIGLLREALTGTFYQGFITAQKSSEGSFAPPLGIKILQEFSLNIFLGVKAMPHYLELGETISNQVQITSTSAGPLQSPRDLPPFLQQSIHVVKKTMHTDSGVVGKIAYAITHRKQAKAAFASVSGNNGISRILGKEGRVYDTHKKIENNPSLQGTTIWEGVQNNQVHVDNVFCGSPTIGNDAIYPELLCVLDTISANNRLPAEQRNPKIPNRLIYTNFQNLAAKSGEGTRSVILMELAEKYPTAFVGITLAKDSDFYLGKNDAWHGLDTIKDFGSRMGLHMHLDMQKGLNNRTQRSNKGQGFYFPASSDIIWGNVLPTIITRATEVFETKETPNMTPVEKKEMYMAYQEFVYSLIQDYVEMEFAKDPGTTRLMTITACKEHADRAAMESLKKLYLRWFSQEQMSKDSNQSTSLLCAGMHARALQTRERLVIEHRTEAVLAFMKHITPEEYQEVRKSLNPQVTATFIPALS